MMGELIVFLVTYPAGGDALEWALRWVLESVRGKG